MAKSTQAPEPADPELAPLARSFEQGDFARLGEQLAQLPEPKPKSAQAGALRAAVSVDPAHAVVLVLCALALVAIALRYFS